VGIVASISSRAQDVGVRDEWREGTVTSTTTQLRRARAAKPPVRPPGCPERTVPDQQPTERNRGKIGLHGTLRWRRSGGSRALVSEEEPTHNNSGRGALVSYRQREMGAGGQGTHYLYQPAGVHCGCGRKRLCSRSGCGAGMALGLGARAAVRCAAAEAPSSRWLGSAPPRATRRHLQGGKQLLPPQVTSSETRQP